MRDQDVLVIGAGIGGIASAARLAKEGYRVKVLEKNEIPGGRCGYMDVQGHRFDTGPTLYLMPDLYKKAFNSLGENIEDYIELRRVDPTYRINYSDGFQLILSTDLGCMKTQLEEIESGSFQQYLEYLEEGLDHYQIALPTIVTKQFLTPLSFFNVRNFQLILRIKALTKHYHRIGDFFRDERLKFSIIFQNLYMGLNPYDAPAIYSMMPYTELVDGIWFPKGRMDSITEALVSIAVKNGVEFEYSTPVSRILSENKKVIGVQLEDGRSYHADIIVTNADLSYVYKELLPENKVSKRLEKKKYGCSATTFFWGIKQTIPQLGPHNLFLGKDIKEGFEKIFNSLDLSESPSFYIHAPVRIDPSLAPHGDDTLVIAVPVPHLNMEESQDWNELVYRSRKYIIQRLMGLGIPDIESLIKFEVVFTPEDWKKRYNLTKGSAHGLGHDLLKMGYMRPANRHKSFHNLYFVGASTHPGTGLPSVLTSAEFVSDRIMMEKSL